MSKHIVTEHEEVMDLIHKFGGRPAPLSGGEGIRISFGDDPSIEDLPWEEFFDVFDSRRLALKYDDEEGENNPAGTLTIISLDKQDGEVEDETELPEDRPEMDENLFPSQDRAEYTSTEQGADDE